MLGASVVVLVAAAFGAGFAGLVMRVRPGAWVVVVAVTIQVVFVTVTWRRLGAARPVVAIAVSVLVVWLLVLLAGAATQFTTDTSVDGRHYQGETTRAVARGWNPVRDGPLFPRDAPYQPDAVPKASAIVGATVLRVTDSIDTTRLVGTILLVAAALLAVAALSAAGAGAGLAVVGGVALAANPVALSQLGTAMVDGVVSSLLLSTLALGLLWVWRHPPVVVLPALAGALALLVNTKFTGLVYVGLIVVPVLLLAGLLARLGRRLVWMLLAVTGVTIVAMLGLGYNPYVTNQLRHDHPLHPVYGPDQLDIGAQYRTGDLEDASAPERLVLSVLGRSTNDDVVELKAPFTFTSHEWSSFRSPSVRIGGFGPWYSGALLIAAVALAAALVTRPRRDRTAAPYAWTLLGIACICLVATVVQPSSFLARFAPQLWFVAPLVAIAVALVAGSRWALVVAWVVLGVLVVDAAGVAAATAVWDKRDTDREATSLARIRRISPVYANFSSWPRSEARRLREAGIRVRAVDFVPCKFPWVFSVAGGLTVRQQFPGVPPPAGGVQICPVTPMPERFG